MERTGRTALESPETSRRCDRERASQVARRNIRVEERASITS
jgi:hypothetical protein